MTGPGGAASIADHALLSDLQTAALIDRCGTVDWWCVPRFDSAACFAALLDTPAAGGSRLAPAGRPGGVHAPSLSRRHAGPRDRVG